MRTRALQAEFLRRVPAFRVRDPEPGRTIEGRTSGVPASRKGNRACRWNSLFHQSKRCLLRPATKPKSEADTPWLHAIEAPKSKVPASREGRKACRLARRADASKRLSLGVPGSGERRRVCRWSCQLHQSKRLKQRQSIEPKSEATHSPEPGYAEVSPLPITSSRRFRIAPTGCASWLTAPATPAVMNRSGHRESLPRRKVWANVLR
ncbi:hypothetical protein SCOR_33670 [Sulfidibacter corallicola]